MQDGIFPANHWVDGQKLAHHPSNPLWIPRHASDDFDTHGNMQIIPNTPTDTAFQILKVAAYADLVDISRDVRQQDPRLIELEAKQYDSDLKAIQERVAAWAESWLNTLRDFDKRGSFAWPHAKNESSRDFMLDDHLWIWMAIKTFEHPSLRVWSSLRAKQISRRSEDRVLSLFKEDHLGWLLKSFAANKIQREITDRFTTWKDNSSVRMLAVERSLQRTRFAFEFGDTALFYAQELGFFRTGDQSVYGPWLETIMSQTKYESSQDSELDAPLRCGFEILSQASNYSRISKEYGSLQQLEAAMEVVLGIMDSNGLFPVKLDVMTKDPVTCVQHNLTNEDINVDDYFRSSFELPFILLSSIDFWSQLELPTCSYGRPVPDEKRLGLSSLSKPLLHLRTPQNIVEIEDEWLFDYPPFFDNEFRLDLASERSRPELEGTVFQELMMPSGSASTSTTSLLRGPSEAPESSSTVVDIQSAVQGNGILIFTSDISILKTPYLVAEAFKGPRTAAQAKKRLVHLYGADLKTAFLYYANTTGQEKDNILWFFQRNSDRLNYFYDDCARVSNKWETELHLSFHQIVKDDKPRPLAQIAEFRGKWSEIISRAAIGFRFDGDLFDKYWTATVVESLAASKSPQPLFRESIEKQKESTAWRQRKVLELEILSMMLSRAHEFTAKIFNDVKYELKVDQDFSIFSRKPDSDNYDVLSSRWRAFEPILQVLEEDLLEIEEYIGQWNRREDERGYVRPRWTPEQEREYRGDINKQVRVVRNWTNKVRHLRNDVQKLRLFFKDQLTNTREEIDFHNSNNITYFTYVTIVFAPLGFGAGIFSTSGPPSVAALQGVVLCAVVALAITAVILINARVLVNVLKLILKHIRIITNVAKDMSLLPDMNSAKRSKERKSIQKERNQMESNQMESNQEEGSEKESMERHAVDDDKPIKLGTIRGLWYLNFWLAYLFLELPAKRVASAYHILLGWKKGILKQFTTKKADPGRALEAASTCDIPSNSSSSKMDNILGVLAGFGLLPIFSITWVLQLILYTIADGLIYLGGK